MPAKTFFCYSHEDEALLNQLKGHLKPLEQLSLIEMWCDRNISAGAEWKQEINKQLKAANIILLLVSRSFMASDYCCGIEMKQALERHKKEEVRVIPIILCPVYWREAPFSNLQVLPTDGKPITTWDNQDEAFLNTVKGIREVVERLSPMYFKQQVEESQKAYYQALAAATKVGVCLQCGSTDLEYQVYDDAGDETYYFVHCKKCNWVDEADPPIYEAGLPTDEEDFESLLEQD